MLVPGEFERCAPYAPISSLREFFERIRDIAVPVRVDRKFLQKLNVASNNEWALLSALKFLEIVDEHGAPTHAYRQLQTTDKARTALRHLVETAYGPLFQVGGVSMSIDDLRNYFRVSSSPSQAKNAARFFREVCDMAGVGREIERDVTVQHAAAVSASSGARHPSDDANATDSAVVPTPDMVLVAKVHLLERLPALRPEWTAAEYTALCDRFLQLMRNLDRRE